jgi:lysophospholipase L1-like esterase
VADAVLTIAAKEHLRVVDLYHDPRLSVPHLVHFKRLKDPQTGRYRDFTWPEYTNIPFDPAGEYPYPPEAIDMTYDGLHPSDKGDALIAKRLIKVLKKL